MVPACINAQKTECGCLRAVKLKTVMYVFLPRHKEAHKENAASKQASVHGNIMSCLTRDWGTPASTNSVLFPYRVERNHNILAPWTRALHLYSQPFDQTPHYLRESGNGGVKSRLLFVSFSAPNCHASYHWLPKLLPFLMVKKTKPIVSRVSLMR